MAMIALVCPACGGKLTMDDSRESCFCEFCGVKVVKDKQYIEVSGKVSVDGIAKKQALLDRAYLFLEDGNFINANEYFERVLDLNPHCSNAYIGKLLCKLRFRNINRLYGIKDKSLTNFDEFNKALRFATPEELIVYKRIANAVRKNCKKRDKQTLATLVIMAIIGVLFGAMVLATPSLSVSDRRFIFIFFVALSAAPLIIQAIKIKVKYPK